MTLILTDLHQRFALQVSDRLTSTAPGVGWDRTANKAVVFRGRDGVISVAYSGSAYINGFPTDHWIAEQLVGEQIRVRGFVPGPRELSDIGLAMRRLAEAANDVRRWAVTTDFVAGGFQWPVGAPHQARPVLWGVSKKNDPGGGKYVPGEAMSRWRGGYFAAAPRGALLDLDGLRPDLSAAAARDDHETIEFKLVAAVKRAAALPEAVVGGDCISVLLIPPDPARTRDWPIARIRYYAESEHPATFAPWIIIPGRIFPPVEILVTTTIRSSWMLASIEAPSGTQGIFRTQDRKRAPGRRSRWPHSIPRDD
jgi:hypothetical protein